MKKTRGVFVALLLLVMLLSMSALADATCTGSNCAGSSIENEVGQNQGQTLINNPVSVDNRSISGTLSTNQGQSLINAPVDNSSVNSENKLTTEQGQALIFAPQSNNNRSIGSLPSTFTHNIGAAEFPLNDYGHQVTQFSLKTSVKFMKVLTSQEVKTIKEINDGMKGTEEWESRDKKITATPFIKRMGSYSNGRAFYIDPKEFIEKILPRLSDEHIMGIIVYNSKLNKENPVLSPHFQVRAFEDLASKGANVFIPVDQFYQAYFVPEGFEFSVSGLFSIISSSVLKGGAVSPSAGIALQRNTEFGRSGAAFAVCSVPEAILFAQPAQPVAKPEPKPEEKPRCSVNELNELYKRLQENYVKIYGDKRTGKKGCEDYCFNNEGLRDERQFLFYEVYKCTGDGEALREVIYNCEVAARNYKFGKDIKENQAEADKIMTRVYESWASAKKEVK